MKVLVVKMSSMGDVLHTLPALSDAMAARPGLRFDWVVEEAFAEIPAWHAGVDRVIPVAMRRWRKSPFAAATRGEWRALRETLRAVSYDCVIDAQGLLKSALVTRLVRARRYGLDRHSAREPLAARLYDRRLAVPWGQHAVTRVRQLFAQVLEYELSDAPPDYGIAGRLSCLPVESTPYIFFLHGTTWASKLWPEPYWIELAGQAHSAGYGVRLTWGDETERARAERIAAGCEQVTVMPRMGLAQAARALAGAAGIVAVDSGLGHLAAALEVPAVSIYGATDPARTGTMGLHQRHLSAQFECAPCLARQCRYQGPAAVSPACYASVPPAAVWSELQSLLPSTSGLPDAL